MKTNNMTYCYFISLPLVFALGAVRACEDPPAPECKVVTSPGGAQISGRDYTPDGGHECR